MGYFLISRHIVETQQDNAETVDSRYPDLSPVFLPFKTQHYVFTKIQAALEKACFEFGHQKMPKVMEKNRWDHPEAMELTAWVAEARILPSLFLARQTQTGISILKVLTAVANIRHTAVHRVRITGKEVEVCLLDAERLATLLDDSTCYETVSFVRRRVRETMKEIELNNQLLVSRLEATRNEISVKISELGGRLEREVTAKTAQLGAQHQLYVGMKMEQAINSVTERTETLTANDKSDGHPGGEGMGRSTERHGSETSLDPLPIDDGNEHSTIETTGNSQAEDIAESGVPVVKYGIEEDWGSRFRCLVVLLVIIVVLVNNIVTIFGMLFIPAMAVVLLPGSRHMKA